MKLTLTCIGNLKCPAGKRDTLVFDEEQRGLGVRVTAAGSKTYLAQYTFHGHTSAGSRSAQQAPSRWLKLAMPCAPSLAMWQRA
jgi:hypothetical protein